MPRVEAALRFTTLMGEALMFWIAFSLLNENQFDEVYRHSFFRHNSVKMADKPNGEYSMVKKMADNWGIKRVAGNRGIHRGYQESFCSWDFWKKSRKRIGQSKYMHGMLATVTDIKVADNRGRRKVADNRGINGRCLPPERFFLQYAEGGITKIYRYQWRVCIWNVLKAHEILPVH